MHPAPPIELVRGTEELGREDADLASVRFALFHILQAGARAEQRPITAKGLTGSHRMSSGLAHASNRAGCRFGGSN
jgi:hypothetical protein